MADKDNDDKKIIVDEDWKAQAQKEKEDLVKETEAKEAEDVQTQEKREMPAADFSGLVSMLTTQAFFALGLIRGEEDKEQPPDLQLAKYNIDLLDVIEQKSKGNLNEDEEKLLSGALHQLHMAFVKISQ